jgi:hypothetical protein
MRSTSAPLRRLALERAASLRTSLAQTTMDAHEQYGLPHHETPAVSIVARPAPWEARVCPSRRDKESPP